MATTPPRVRFAPSPTGALHIGGARTALFNWLFARRHGGIFILRIEDTDLERSTREFEQSILDGLSWLGMDWDEGPYYQTQRTELYRQHVARLMEEGKAYPCTCSPEELETNRLAALAEGRKPKYDGRCRNGLAHPERTAAIRFKGPTEGTTEFHDLCRGTVRFANAELDDLIIARSDDSPTYNFTVVVDDVTMGITHVIRGDDHLNNTPRQVLLYQALGYPVPAFAHLPMIHGPDRKKLSKRHGATSVIEYERMGYLPDAMVNALARLGWSHGDQEIFSREELVERFDLSVVGAAPSIFDTEKLAWINSQHLGKLCDEKLAELAAPFLAQMGLATGELAYAARAIATERSRGRTLRELAEISAFYFRDHVEVEPQAAKKWLDAGHLAILRQVREEIAALPSLSESTLAPLFSEIMQGEGLKMLEIAQPVRVAMTGTTVSPGIYEVLSILGKDRVLARLDRVLASGETG